MIQKYIFGTYIETEAVVKEIAESVGQIPYLTKESDHVFTYQMGEDDIVYGLGESIRGMNKRGWVYEAYCNDDPNHIENIRSLYGAHNFFLVDGAETFGVFVDAPQKVQFDIGYTEREMMKITIAEAAM